MTAVRSSASFGLVLVAAATLAAAAPAQEVRMPEETDKEGKPYTPPLPTKSLEGVDRDGMKTGNPAVVWVASKGIMPTTLPGSKAEYLLGARPVPFLQPYRIASRYQGKERNYVLLAEGKGGLAAVITLVGWVPADLVIEGNESLRDADSIYRKALLVNTKESLEKKDDPRTVPLRDSPSTSAKVLADLKLANYLFVWAETFDGTWVLLGGSYFFQPGDQKDAGRVVLGWAPTRRVMFWKTREALEWDVASTLDPKARRPLGYVFSDPDAAKVYLETGRLAEEKVLYPEKRLPDGTAREMKPYEPRYPVLAWESERQRKKYTVGSNSLIRVAWIGGGGAEEIARKREKLRQIQGQMDNLEILFVMDETGSMRNWYEEAAKAVQQIVEDARNTPVKLVKIAFAFYADDEEGAKPAKPMKLVDARSKVGERLVEMLERRARDKNDVVGGGGPREMVFNGIREAVAGAVFSPLARKLVVVIGDDGDKSDPDDPKHPGEAELARLLAKPGQTACELLVVQVENRGADGDAFAKQMKTLGRLLDKEVGESVSHFYPLSARLQFVKRVSRGYQQLVAKLQKEEKDLERLRLGDVTSTADLGPGLVKVLRERGLNPDDFKNVQVCEPGYVWRYADADGTTPQVNVRVLYSSYDIDELLRLIKPVVEYRPGTTALKDLYAEEVQKATTGRAPGGAAAGKPPTGLSFDEAVLQWRGLTVRSPLLRKEPSRLPDRLVEEELYQLKLRRALLRDAQQKKVRQYRRRETLVAGIPYYDVEEDPDTPARDLNRVYSLPGNPDEYFWLDFLKELP